MANKHILKKTRRQAAVKIVGTGNVTITVAELAYHDQTVDAANVKLTITDIAYDVDKSATINRNGNVVFIMNPGQTEFNFTQKMGVSLNDDANGDLFVDLDSGTGGTVILQFSKEAGYVDPNRQNQGPGSL